MRSSVELSYGENLADALRLRAMLDAIDGCPAPVVARVQGHALGGGCGLVACCDIVVAEARRAVCVQRGEARDRAGGDLAVRAREDRAKRRAALVRHGRALRAEVALRIGLIHEVADDLDGAVERVAHRVAHAPARSGTRGQGARSRRRESAEETARSIAAHRTSSEGQEGLRAFLEKRPASWKQT